MQHLIGLLFVVMKTLSDDKNASIWFGFEEQRKENE